MVSKAVRGLCQLQYILPPAQNPGNGKGSVESPQSPIMALGADQNAKPSNNITILLPLSPHHPHPHHHPTAVHCATTSLLPAP